MSNTKSIQLKLYLEGIRVPIKSITINEQVGQPPSATIDLPMTKRIKEIKERTVVQVFYLEQSGQEDSQWVLVFEGEVTAYGFSRSFNSNSVILRCVHYTDHWNYIQKDINKFSHYKGREKIKITGETGTGWSSLDETAAERHFSEEIVNKTTSSDDKWKNVKPNLQSSIEEPLNYIFNLAVSEGIINLETMVDEIISKDQYSLGTLFKGIIDNFAKNNVGYSLFHIVYQMGKRIITMQNNKAEEILKTKKTHKFLRGELKNLKGSSNVFQLLRLIFNMFEYTMLIPSAPTYDENSQSPQSLVFLPASDLIPPVNCNIIFSEQAVQFSFQENFAKKPTRLGDNLYPSWTEGDGNEELEIFEKLVISPQAGVAIDAQTGRPRFALTREERLKGINGVQTHSGYELLYAKDIFNKKKGNLSTPKSEVGDYTTKLRQRKVDTAFGRLRRQQAAFNIDTTYSPYRIVGLPAAFLNEEVFSVTGIISQMISSIDVEGKATSQITFTQPQVLEPYDWSLTSEDIDKVLEQFGYTDLSEDKKEMLYPFGDYKGTDKQNQKWIQKLLLDRYVPERYEFLKTWLDRDKYMADVASDQIYRKLVYGIEPDDDTDEAYPYSKEHGGILSFINFDAGVPFDTSNDDLSDLNSQWINYSLFMTLQQYKLKEEDRKSEFVKRFTKRKLVTEKQYWEFFIDEPHVDILNNKKLDDEDVLNKGIRTISVAPIEEGKRVLKHLKQSARKASAPFIEERRAVIRALKKELNN